MVDRPISESTRPRFTLIELLVAKPDEARRSACATKAKTRACSRSFTLIELLVVVAIIAVLAAMLLPALTRAKYTANIIVCLNNQKQVAVGYMMYADDYGEQYPYPSCADGDNCTAGETTHARLNGKHVRQACRELNSAHWDSMRKDVEMTYFGGRDAAKGIFTCPLIEHRWNDRGESRTYAKVDSRFDDREPGNTAIAFPYQPIKSDSRRRVPFSTYFNIDPGRGRVSRAMMKVGDTWKMAKGSSVSANSKGKECDVLLSDFMSSPGNYPGNSTQVSNHYEWGSGEFRQYGEIGNWNTDAYAYRSLAPTNANFIRSDGSGENVKDLHQAVRPDITGGVGAKFGGGVVPLSMVE